MKKHSSVLIGFLFLCLLSCTKEKVAQTYGEKIVGTWNRDSVITFDSDTNFISKVTDPDQYTFLKSAEGEDQYLWIHNTNPSGITVQMIESAGEMYQLTLGESTWRWQIRFINDHNCYLYRPKGSFFPFIEKIYLSR